MPLLVPLLVPLPVTLLVPLPVTFELEEEEARESVEEAESRCVWPRLDSCASCSESMLKRRVFDGGGEGRVVGTPSVNLEGRGVEREGDENGIDGAFLEGVVGVGAIVDEGVDLDILAYLCGVLNQPWLLVVQDLRVVCYVVSIAHEG